MASRDGSRYANTPSAPELNRSVSDEAQPCNERKALATPGGLNLRERRDMFTAIGSDRPTDRERRQLRTRKPSFHHLYVKYSDLTVLSVLNSLGCGEVS